MTVREQLAVVAALSFVAIAGAGCKKSVDLSAFDAGATAAATPDTADAAVAADTADAAPDADVEALTNAKPAHATAPKASAKPAASATAPQPKSTGIPECDEAGRICASVHGNATRVLCANKTAECLKRGGHVPSQ